MGPALRAAGRWGRTLTSKLARAQVNGNPKQDSSVSANPLGADALSLLRVHRPDLGRCGATRHHVVWQKHPSLHQIGEGGRTIGLGHILSRRGVTGAKSEARAGQSLRFSAGTAGTGGTVIISNTYSGAMARAPSGTGGTGHARGPVGPKRLRESGPDFSVAINAVPPVPAVPPGNMGSAGSDVIIAQPQDLLLHRIGPKGTPLPRQPAVSSHRSLPGPGRAMPRRTDAAPRGSGQDLNLGFQVMSRRRETCATPPSPDLAHQRHGHRFGPLRHDHNGQTSVNDRDMVPRDRPIARRAIARQRIHRRPVAVREGAGPAGRSLLMQKHPGADQAPREAHDRDVDRSHWGDARRLGGIACPCLLNRERKVRSEGRNNALDVRGGSSVARRDWVTASYGSTRRCRMRGLRSQGRASRRSRETLAFLNIGSLRGGIGGCCKREVVTAETLCPERPANRLVPVSGADHKAFQGPSAMVSGEAAQCCVRWFSRDASFGVRLAGLAERLSVSMPFRGVDRRAPSSKPAQGSCCDFPLGRLGPVGRR
jgi:hypothetical protein